MDEKKDLCVLRISGERWETSVLSGLRSMPVWKNKVLHALDFVSINLLFRGKTQVLRKTTFVTVCSWNCLSNSRRLYHFDSRSSPFSQQEGGKRREAKTLTSEVSWFVFVAWRPGRQSDVEIWRRQSTSSLPRQILPRGWEPAERSPISLHVSPANASVLQPRSSGPPLIWLLQLGFSSCRRGATKQAFSHVLFSHRSSEGRALLVSDFFKCTCIHFGEETVTTTSRSELVSFHRET